MVILVDPTSRVRAPRPVKQPALLECPGCRLIGGSATPASSTRTMCRVDFRVGFMVPPGRYAPDTRPPVMRIVATS